jgi:hypothetical protein
MALPGKSARRITVNGQSYDWMATGNSYYVDLIVLATPENGQKVKALVAYRERTVPVAGNHHAARCETSHRVGLSQWLEPDAKRP